MTGKANVETTITTVKGILFVGFLSPAEKSHCWFYEITSKGTTIVRSG